MLNICNNLASQSIEDSENRDDYIGVETILSISLNIDIDEKPLEFYRIILIR